MKIRGEKVQWYIYIHLYTLYGMKMMKSAVPFLHENCVSVCVYTMCTGTHTHTHQVSQKVEEKSEKKKLCSVKKELKKE